ncbi:MAG: hypothetical protein ACREQ5_00030 [Candidatus Dormibacteria bacterium]
MKVNAGNDGQAGAMGGDVAGFTGTATATSSTSLTATGTPFVASAFIGHIVVPNTATPVYGVITANTTSVLTVDTWYAPGSPGVGGATTPGATSVYTILPGQAPYWYMAITTDSAAASSGDTTLPSEITTAGGGLIRKLSTYAHTTGVASYSLAATFTVNGSDTGLPAAVAKMGIFNTLTGATGRMQFETKLGTTATVSAIGDQVTITDTVTN